MKEFSVNLLKKFTARKFIAMLLGVAVGIAVILGADGETISSAAGAVTAALSSVIYIFTEGKIDMEAIGKQSGEDAEKK